MLKVILALKSGKNHIKIKEWYYMFQENGGTAPPVTPYNEHHHWIKPHVL